MYPVSVSWPFILTSSPSVIQNSVTNRTIIVLYIFIIPLGDLSRRCNASRHWRQQSDKIIIQAESKNTYFVWIQVDVPIFSKNFAEHYKLNKAGKTMSIILKLDYTVLYFLMWKEGCMLHFVSLYFCYSWVLSCGRWFLTYHNWGLRSKNGNDFKNWQIYLFKLI